ncbi:ROK family protein (putative glucokinase) [Caldanaerobius fijiensis DSM 17918]|uniref:ROK family protein (Putative glucokinase) n=1 Tax=Caldanaerobius fijiensis DSM 17918 TaxID=1121256 RepID=A0A1M5CVJ4_9THEO|nr:ROK family transcriptional regulator [Caldanaerobius fijiensis]SHF58761.1 ROK family protein (putative glucokinase) [Caldanaerobius fijiensis DSM 17918]
MANLIPVSYKLLKGMNESLVIRIIKEKGAISRADIARYTNLTPPTVTNITKKLIKDGVIVEDTMGESRGGRKPVLLKLNPGYFYVVLAHISSNHLRLDVSDLDTNVLASKRIKLSDKSPEAVLKNLFALYRQMVDQSGVPEDKIAGIGVAVHGLVDSERGISLYAPNLGWRDVNLLESIKAELGIEVCVENDVRAMAMGERWYGAAKGVDNFLAVKVGYGIGASAVVDGKLYTGITHSSGEIGHTTIDVNGPKCSCGNYGCLEAMASERAICETMSKRLKLGEKSIIKDVDDVDIEDVYRAANIGDELAIDVIKRISIYLGIGIANLINLFNPQLVVLGGNIIKVKDIVKPVLEDVVKQRALDNTYRGCKLVMSNLGDDATIKGAHALILSHLFDM